MILRELRLEYVWKEAIVYLKEELNEYVEYNQCFIFFIGNMLDQ